MGSSIQSPKMLQNSKHLDNFFFPQIKSRPLAYHSQQLVEYLLCVGHKQSLSQPPICFGGRVINHKTSL